MHSFELPVSQAVVFALAGFSFVSSITPGPNNFMLLASGVNYGFVRTIPHMLGIVVGFALLLLCVGFGLGQLLETWPPAYTALKIAGGAYLVYLAWRIAMSGPVGEVERTGRGRPMNFVEAAAFQWVNPKAWVMAVTSMSLFTNPTSYAASVLTVIVVFTAINLPCVSAWCGMGMGLRQFLSDTTRLRLFNWIMAALLVASLWPMLR